MTDLAHIERRLRALAAKFTGTEMGHRLPKDDHGSSRSLGVTFVNDAGEDVDVGEELLDIADEIAMRSLPKVEPAQEPRPEKSQGKSDGMR